MLCTAAAPVGLGGSKCNVSIMAAHPIHCHPDPSAHLAWGVRDVQVYNASFPLSSSSAS